ncbi:hypothetical protein WDU94_011017 [Cyamophila willieti]
MELAPISLSLVLLLTMVPRVCFGAAKSRYNLTCYDCETHYTGDACHVVTRITPRSTQYNESSEMMFCIFYRLPIVSEDLPKVYRGFSSFVPYFGGGTDYAKWKSWVCLKNFSIWATWNIKLEDCAYCQRDLCNTGHQFGKNYDVDGFYGNGSLVTPNRTVYEYPVLGTERGGGGGEEGGEEEEEEEEEDVLYIFGTSLL